VGKTFEYKLTPTPAQEQTMAFVLRRCCELYNAGHEERREVRRQCAVSMTGASMTAQLLDIKAVRPEFHAVHFVGVA
jgi:putative transposase